MFSPQIHRYIYWLGLATMTVSLPLSPFLLSAGLFTLAGNWLAEFGFRHKYKTLANKPAIVFFLTIFFIHVIGLAYSSNWQYALHDIKIKLPLLGLPIIIGTTRPLDRREFRILKYLFLGSVFVATIVSAYIYLGVGRLEPIDNRNASVIISHIRFALMLILAIYMLVGLIKEKYRFLLIPQLIVLAWLCFYLLFIGAFTGTVILVISLPIVTFYWLRENSMPKLKLLIKWLVAIFTLLIAAYFAYSIHRYLDREEVNPDSLPEYTANGRTYQHYIKSPSYENGHKVWLYVCDGELYMGWNAISKIDYNGYDLKGQTIRHTLIRYLTSLGYSKDSVGLSKLTPEDVVMVEKGYTNYIFKYKWSLYTRLYVIFWEFENYMYTGNPSGHSLLQRMEMVKNGFACFKRFPLFGTGTGDINDEILKQYKIDDSVLEPQWQFRPHNQYLTFLTTFGVIGFSLMVLSFILGIKKQKEYLDFIAIAFLCIVLVSMLSEDTLETQAGANYFAFFLSILLLGRTNKPVQ